MGDLGLIDNHAALSKPGWVDGAGQKGQEASGVAGSPQIPDLPELLALESPVELLAIKPIAA